MMEFGKVKGLASEIEVKPVNPYTEPVKKNRVFELSCAPTLYPSEKEFEDPYAYINSIAKLGEQYGILKIVPPASWRPKFRLDPSRFIFTTRKQRLSSIGAVTRATNSWIERLSKFHLFESGWRIDKQPFVNNKKLNYYLLKCAVESLGGFEQVCNHNLWPEVMNKLGLGDPQTEDLKTAYHVHQIYDRVIRPYEEYAELVLNSNLFKDLTIDFINTKNKMTPPPEEKYLMDHKLEGKAEDNGEEEDEEEEQMRPPRKKRIGNGGRMFNLKTDRSGDSSGAAAHASDKHDSDDEYDHCTICDKAVNEGDLSCANSNCERDYHYSCLGRPIALVCDPSKSVRGWYCPRCLVGTGEFYFDQGDDEYTLDEFKDKADEFKAKYLKKIKVKGDETDFNELENIVEEKFWNHVEDLDCNIEIEYGADCQCDELGSGFPNISDHPRDPYVKDLWNLNNFSKHRKSLFRVVKEISGVTVPWGYVGMMFSAFCWHSEDHYTYSVNYQHLGATKTWYGIPGSYAEKFEAASREMVPELFAKQPDLLFQRATMISPSFLKQKGVPVYAIDQHPGQFVITFPKAYHSGFNHGFNFNEAVNYAPPQWVPFGEECIVSYRHQKREPLFSHDWLLMTIAKQDTSKETASWLYPHILKLVQQEDLGRKRIKRLHPNVNVQLVKTESRDRKLYQCCECNTYSYLSRVVVQRDAPVDEDDEDSDGSENDDSSYKVYCLYHVPLKVNKRSTLTLELREYARDLKLFTSTLYNRLGVKK